MDEAGVLRLKRRLHCGPRGRLLEWHSRMLLRAEQEKWDVSKIWIRSSTFGVRSSEHLELRTSNPRLSRLSLATYIPIDQCSNDRIVYA
jgi:hypothetical protein